MQIYSYNLIKNSSFLINPEFQLYTNDFFKCSSSRNASLKAELYCTIKVPIYSTPFRFVSLQKVSSCAGFYKKNVFPYEALRVRSLLADSLMNSFMF
jgi:hypothetical protein